MKSIILRFLEFRIALEAPHSICEQIIELGHPYFIQENSNSSGLIDLQIRFEIRPDTYGELMKNKQAGRNIELHAGMVGVYLSSEIHHQVVVNEKQMIVIIPRIGQEKNLNVIVYELLSGHALELFRLIRGIFIAYAERSGKYIRGHAAGIKINNEVFLILGSKGAGKTSFLTTALKTGANVSLITNDKCLIDREGNIWGLPYAVTISPESIYDCPEIQLRDTVGTTETGKHMFWPSKFASAFGAGILQGGKLNAIIVPSIDLLKDKVCISKLTLAESIPYIELLYQDKDKMNPKWLIELLNIAIDHNTSQKPRMEMFDSYSCAGNPWKEEWVLKLMGGFLYGST